jgi:large subunit ribosomal protein L8e
LKKLINISLGTLICNVESIVGNRGNLSRASGCYATIIGHAEDGSKTRLKLPSGARKTVSGSVRAMIGVVAGGDRTSKPVLKAGISHFKHRIRRSAWPRIRGVCMNPVDHPHGFLNNFILIRWW